MAQIFAREFFENTALYKWFQDETIQIVPPNVHKYPGVRCNCDICESEQTFRYEEGTIQRWAHISGGHPLNVPVALPNFDDHNEHLLNIDFLCAGCSQKQLHFFVLAKRGAVMKVGQWPSWYPEIANDIRNFLEEDAALFVKGRDCESHGYGIGAFSYYRRVVENSLDRLLESMRDLATEGQRNELDAALKALGASASATERIEVAAKLLPPSLTVGDANPLKLVYGALSVGIHGLEDQDCLDRAQIIREALTYMVSTMTHAKQNHASFSEAMKKLSKFHKRTSGEDAES